MMVPGLAPKLAEALASLRADGITPTDAEIVWLARLRWACDHQRSFDADGIVGSSVDMFGQRFYPLHRLAEHWFVSACELNDDAAFHTAVYMFAHVFSAPGDRTLLTLSDEKSVKEVVWAWRNSLPIHDENEGEFVRLLRMIDRYTEDISTDTDKADERINPFSGVASLCRMFPGTTPDYWQTGMSTGEIALLLDADKTSQWATSSDRTRAIAAFLSAVKYIRQQHIEAPNA